MEGQELITKKVSLRSALNEVMRNAYTLDNEKALAKWNKELLDHHIDHQLTLPHKRFNRTAGEYAAHRFSPEGLLISEADFLKAAHQWLPTAKDREFVKSLMRPVTEQKKVAAWIAPPAKGINGQPVD